MWTGNISCLQVRRTIGSTVHSGVARVVQYSIAQKMLEMMLCVDRIRSKVPALANCTKIFVRSRCCGQIADCSLKFCGIQSFLWVESPIRSKLSGKGNRIYNHELTAYV